MGFEIENGVLKKYTEEQDVTEVVIPDGVTALPMSPSPTARRVLEIRRLKDATTLPTSPSQTV